MVDVGKDRVSERYLNHLIRKIGMQSNSTNNKINQKQINNLKRDRMINQSEIEKNYDISFILQNQKRPSKLKQKQRKLNG